MEGEKNAGQLDPRARSNPWARSCLSGPCAHFQRLHQGPGRGAATLLTHRLLSQIDRSAHRCALESSNTLRTFSAFLVQRQGQSTCPGDYSSSTLFFSMSLSRLEEFLKMDNDRNWRFRFELCSQVKPPAESKSSLWTTFLCCFKLELDNSKNATRR